MNKVVKSMLFGGVALAALSVTAPSFAQETSASMRGAVVSEQGAPLAGVSVTVKHLPTGQTKTYETNNSGVFFARGLPVGGPYEVMMADGSSYNARTIEDLFLSLGQASNVTLVASTLAMEEIVVTAVQGSSLIKTGAAAEYGREDIDRMPSINRDIKSVLRTDPRVWIDPTNDDAISIAGTNNRFNTLTVDGIKQNDDFGLNDNGYPTQRSPISLDAIEQISVQTAPFDVEYGSFQGGAINVVTKSGSNEWHGGIFRNYSDSGLVGDKSDGQDVSVGEFKEKQWGAHLGGPILKDKLFFFASYEEFNASNPFEFGPEGSGAANEIIGVTQADIDRVIQITQDVYGFDPLTFGADSLQESDEKFLAKVDWYINEDHRASVTYQYTTGNVVNPQNTFSGSTENPGSAGLFSNWYNKTDTLETWSFQAFSDWTDALSTEVKLGLKSVRTAQAPFNGTGFGEMEIETPGGGTILLGPDRFRHNNRLANDTITFKAKADYLWGDHLFTAGYEYDDFDVFNAFVPGSRGEYIFASIDNYEARIADSIAYENAYTNDADDAGAAFKYQIHTLYLQDRWSPTDDLTVFAGVRYERYASNSDPRTNTVFTANYGFDNTENLDGKDVFLPRLGVNYAFDETTTIRGGVGMFSGGSPNVWLANSFSNDGTIIDTTQCSIEFDDCFGLDPLAVLSNLEGTTPPQILQDQLAPGSGNVAAVDPDYSIPTSWKINLAVDKTFDFDNFLGNGWNVTLEAIFTEIQDATRWTDLRRTQVGTAPDGRPIYDVPGGWDLLMTNTGKGSSQVYSFMVDKTWEWEQGNVFWSFAYANSNVDDVNPGESSTPTSNFGRPSTSDRNAEFVGPSNHEIKHRFTSNVTFRQEWIENSPTTVSFFFSTRSGRKFSYVFDDPGNRTGASSTLEEVLADDNAVFGGDREFWRRDSQLMYVPTGVNDPLVTYDGIDAAEFNAWVDEEGLGDYRGGIAPRNIGQSPWVTRLDMRVSQEVDMPGELGAVTFTFDIENLTNLIDNSWGRVEQVPFDYGARIVRAAINDQGQYVYSRFSTVEDEYRFSTLPSLWKIQIGASYKF